MNVIYNGCLPFLGQPKWSVSNGILISMYQETMDHGEKYLKRVITNILVDLKLNVSQSELWIGPRCGKLLPLSSKYPIIKIYSGGKLEASEQNTFNF